MQSLQGLHLRWWRWDRQERTCSQGIVFLLTQTGVHKWGLEECYVSPCSLHLSQVLRKFTPCWVTWGPQLNVFQPTTSKKTDCRHKFHIWGLLRCPTMAPRMYYSKPRISEHESHGSLILLVQRDHLPNQMAFLPVPHTFMV